MYMAVDKYRRLLTRKTFNVLSIKIKFENYSVGFFFLNVVILSSSFYVKATRRRTRIICIQFEGILLSLSRTS